MSLSGHFRSKWIKQDKLGREIRTNEDYRAARIRHADGSHALYRAGKMVAGSHEEPKAKKKAAKDVPGGESKFYKPTETSTIVQKTKGDAETVGKSESAAHVKKKNDVNARAYKL